MLKTTLTLALIALALTGCLKLERDYPAQQTYTLSLSRSGADHNPLAGPLKVLRLQISPRFEGERFTYRTGELQFETDYYSRFLTAPADLISEEIAEWLTRSGLFREVAYGPGRTTPEWYLEGKIARLYGDFVEEPAQAVLEITLSLNRDVQARAETVLHRTYRKAIPLQGQSAAALAQGWNAALGEILRDFEEELLRELRSASS